MKPTAARLELLLEEIENVREKVRDTIDEDCFGDEADGIRIELSRTLEALESAHAAMNDCIEIEARTAS